MAAVELLVDSSSGFSVSSSILNKLPSISHHAGTQVRRALRRPSSIIALKAAKGYCLLDHPAEIHFLAAHTSLRLEILESECKSHRQSGYASRTLNPYPTREVQGGSSVRIPPRIRKAPNTARMFESVGLDSRRPQTSFSLLCSMVAADG